MSGSDLVGNLRRTHGQKNRRFMYLREVRAHTRRSKNEVPLDIGSNRIDFVKVVTLYIHVPHVPHSLRDLYPAGAPPR